MADEIPEQVYLDAARASVAARFPGRPAFAAWVKVDDAEPGFRAAVASAYRAGQAAVPDDVESLPSFGRPVGRRRLMPAAAPDGPRTWQLPDGWAIGEVEYGAAHDANCGHWDFGTASETRESMESWLADHEGWRLIARVRLVPLTDATPADGQDGDGRG